MNHRLSAPRPCLLDTGSASSFIPAFKRVAMWVAAAAIAGCGGGGGGGGAPAAAPPAPAAAASAPPPAVLAGSSYLVAGTSATENGAYSVVVADAESTRAGAVLSVPVQAAAPLMSTIAYTKAANSSAVVISGSPLTFFVNGGELWQIDLGRTRTTAGVRLSSLSDVCEVLLVAPLDASGLDAWVLVSTAGADGNCRGLADNRQALVRSGTPSTVAPHIVPVGTRVQQLFLSGPGGALWWMLALNSSGAVPRMVAYGPNLDVVDVAGGSGILSLNSTGHGSEASEGTYVRTGDVLRRIQASATALSIGAPQLRFIGGSWLTLYDRPSMYFTDEDGVFRVEGDTPATLLARPNPGSGAAMLLAQTPNKLVVVQTNASGRGSVSSVDKRTGAVTPLLTQSGDGSNDVWAVRGETLFYFTGKPTAVGDLRRVEVDGTNDTLVFTNLLLAGRVSARLWERGYTTGVGGTGAVLACQPLPGHADCREGTLIQIDLPSRTITALGSFGASTAPSWLATGSRAYEGVKGAVIEVHSSTAAAPSVHSRQDLYVFNPGEANSLRLVSSSTP